MFSLLADNILEIRTMSCVYLFMYSAQVFKSIIGGCIKVVSSVASTPLKVGVRTFWSACKGLIIVRSVLSFTKINVSCTRVQTARTGLRMHCGYA